MSNPPAVAAAFEEFTGQTIREYLDDRHLDVAERLLVDTDLQIEDVAVQAGFRDSRRLRAALRRRYDVLPTDLRQLGELPEAGPPTAEPFHLTAAARFERRFAESFWRQLGQRPLAELRHSLLHAVTLQTPALFHALGEASRIEGRRDRGRGVEIAELALALLDANAEAVGEAGGELAALGWARLGRARRLALDFAGAEAAFDAATDAWAKLAGKGSPFAEAEIAFMKGTFKMARRAFDEALDLFNRTIALAEAFGGGDLLIKARLQRLGVLCLRGEEAKTIPELRELRRLAIAQDDRRLRFVVNADLALAGAEAGEFETAHEAIQEARELLAEALPLERWQLAWTEGLLYRAEGDLAAAATTLEGAATGMTELEERGYAAIIGLDLAIVAYRQNRSSEVLRLASKVIPVLEGFHLHESARVAQLLLSQAIAADSVPLAILTSVRETLKRIQREDAGSS